jgi:hypothetical protein
MPTLNKHLTVSDVTAAVALILSVSGLIWDAISFWRGAEVQIFPPREIVFRCDAYDIEAKQCNGNIGVGAQNLTYVNLGSKGYGALVLKETLTIPLPQRTITLTWKYFTNIVEGGSGSDKVAGPVHIDGGKTESHETQFRAIERKIKANQKGRKHDFYRWSDFVNEVNSGAVPDQLNLKFTSSIYESGENRIIETHCDVQITERRRANFICDDNLCVRYAVFSCFDQ